MAMEFSHSGKTLKKLAAYLWPKEREDLKLRVVIALLCLFLAKATNVFVPVFYKKAVDLLSIDKESLVYFHFPVLLILSYGFARIGTQIFDGLKDAIFARVEHHGIRTLALETFRHLHHLSLRFHLDRKTGAISQAIERGIKAIETLLRFMLFNIFPTFVEILLVSAVLAFLYDYRFSLVTLLTLLLYITVTLLITEWRTKIVREMNKVDSEANSKAIDSLLNYETVKYYNNEKHEENRYNTFLKSYEKAAIQSKISLSYLNISQGIIIALGLILVMTMAAYDVKNGRMTVGDFVLVNTYLIQLYLPLNVLGFAYREIKLALVNIEHMFALLKEKEEIKNDSKAKSLVVKKGDIKFINVEFSYTEDRPILKRISFHVKAGQKTAIVGESGVGKSTISRLLFRFFDVQKGQILIDNQDIKHVSQESLRATIGIVPQDTVLFNDTLLYNIAYGNLQASASEIDQAIQMSHLNNFIQSLPAGTNTLVGERGLKLSGGEKQRVAIARTLLKKPKIFLFDEATSSLDTHTERIIQKNLLEISKNKTTLIIAHRLSTIIDADEIIVLKTGEIAERGKHVDLLKQKGLYAEMWKKQQKHSKSQ
jgi:ATP-binding cassette subfamily B protein